MFVLPVCTDNTDLETHDKHHVAQSTSYRSQKCSMAEAALRIHLFWKESDIAHKVPYYVSNLLHNEVNEKLINMQISGLAHHLPSIYSKITQSLQLFHISLHSYRFSYRGYFPKTELLHVPKTNKNLFW
jgi:hypothetical protein